MWRRATTVYSLQVDPSKLIAESDEGDNVIPMNFTLRRL